METRRRFFLEGSLWLFVFFDLGLEAVFEREEGRRDPDSPPDRVGRSNPNNVGGFFATIYLNVKNYILLL